MGLKVDELREENADVLMFDWLVGPVVAQGLHEWGRENGSCLIQFKEKYNETDINYRKWENEL